MRILVAKTPEGMARAAARLIAARIAAKPDMNISWCTGRTVIPVYAELVRLKEERAASATPLRVDRLTSFAVDEYAGLPADHPATFRRFLMDRLFVPLGLPPGRIHLLDGSAPDPEAECRRYEAAIEAAGGIDLLLDGVGANAHLGFNEPGSPFGSDTRVVDLTPETRAAQVDFFPSLDDVPRRALTRGIRRIMHARSICIMAFGPSKAPALEAAFLGPVTEQVPCSVLQLHPDLTLVLDADAARPLVADAGTARYVEEAEA